MRNFRTFPVQAIAGAAAYSKEILIQVLFGLQDCKQRSAQGLRQGFGSGFFGQKTGSKILAILMDSLHGVAGNAAHFGKQ